MTFTMSTSNNDFQNPTTPMVFTNTSNTVCSLPWLQQYQRQIFKIHVQSRKFSQPQPNPINVICISTPQGDAPHDQLIETAVVLMAQSCSANANIDQDQPYFVLYSSTFDEKLFHLCKDLGESLYGCLRSNITTIDDCGTRESWPCASMNAFKPVKGTFAEVRAYHGLQQGFTLKWPRSEGFLAGNDAVLRKEEENGRREHIWNEWTAHEKDIQNPNINTPRALITMVLPGLEPIPTLQFDYAECTLGSYILAEQTRPFIPKYELLKQFSCLIQAVEELHTNSIVHMDIKPENIFVFLPYMLKLGDFGSCSGTIENKAPRANFGPFCPPYDGKASEAFDVFSVCAVFVCVLCYIFEGPDGVNSFESQRGAESHAGYFIDKAGILPCVKQKLQIFLDYMHLRCQGTDDDTYACFNKLINVVEKGLDPRPTFRPGLGRIADCLEASLKTAQDVFSLNSFDENS